MDVLYLLLKKLKGADFWIAAAFLISGLICWGWLGTGAAPERQVLTRQIVAVLGLAALAGLAIWINHRVFQREPIFAQNLTGILVLRIAGDDAGNSLQVDLVESLNRQLEKEPTGLPIEVHASREMVNTDRGLAFAHTCACKVGERLNAKLVIWGRKA